MRRPSLLRLLAILAAIAALPPVIAGCGDDGDDDPPASLLETAAQKPIESAELELRADANVPGFPILGSRLILTGDGAFAASGSDALPTADLNVTLRAGGQSFPARITSVDDRVFVDFMGLTYEADRELLEQAGIDEMDGGTAKGVSLAQLGLDPSDWLRNPEVEDGEEIGGDSTRVVTGKVDVGAVIDDLLGVVDVEQLSERLGDTGEGAEGVPELSEENIDQVERAIEKVDVEVNVDDDGYPRRVYAQLDFQMPKDVENTEIEDGTVTFELVLEQIGDVEVDVEPPVDPRPLSSLVRFVGIAFGVEELSDLWETPR